jgi:hypothetical protein
LPQPSRRQGFPLPNSRQRDRVPLGGRVRRFDALSGAGLTRACISLQKNLDKDPIGLSQEESNERESTRDTSPAIARPSVPTKPGDHAGML